MYHVCQQSVSYTHLDVYKRQEQWLENPSWIVYLMIDGDISKRLAQMIYERKCVYMPYLGKNDHPAVIEDSSFVSLMEKEGDEIQSLRCV